MQQSEFHKGREAYLFGEDTKIVNATTEFMAGYRKAWASLEGRKYEKQGIKASNAAFEIHCEQIHSEFRRRTSGPIANAVMGLACAVIFVTLIMSAVLFNDAEIASAVREVLK